ncbi:MAG: ABC transporter ATP-binding protein [Desulfatiglans sp.]|jgi:branched-chain amino acid transport system ATP-binding protein|nr:ABC transporter ATP-binding protein [Thermodesulfobacteriota bacterium]MEE4352295.1 ABC transporter ATP-binding protein [Desulfatiglans sp.]
MLQVNNLEVVYNDIILVLRGISLEVPQGSIIAFLGSNGAGKSTTLMAISGLLEYEDGEIMKGTIEFNGHAIHKMGPQEIVVLGITQVPEGRRIFAELTVEENIRVGAHTRRHGKSEIKRDFDMVLGYFPSLRKRLKVEGGYISGGEQQMLAIARALMGRPVLMMLDEPSLGLAPMLVKEIFNIIQDINRDEKVSILLVEQNALMALMVSEYGYIMENGKIVLDGPSHKLIENEDVKEFYLGVKEDDERKSFADVKHYKRRKRWLS